MEWKQASEEAGESKVAIIGIGTDLCELERFARIARRATPLLLARLLSEQEAQYASGMQQPARLARWLAGVFAAKEAALKACGLGLDGRCGLRLLNTLPQGGHKIEIQLPPLVQELLGGGVRCHAAIAYARRYAAATAVLEQSQKGVRDYGGTAQGRK